MKEKTFRFVHLIAPMKNNLMVRNTKTRKDQRQINNTCSVKKASDNNKMSLEQKKTQG